MKLIKLINKKPYIKCYFDKTFTTYEYVDVYDVWEFYLEKDCNYILLLSRTEEDCYEYYLRPGHLHVMMYELAQFKYKIVFAGWKDDELQYNIEKDENMYIYDDIN